MTFSSEGFARFVVRWSRDALDSIAFQIPAEQAARFIESMVIDDIMDIFGYEFLELEPVAGDGRMRCLGVRGDDAAPLERITTVGRLDVREKTVWLESISVVAAD